MKPQEAVNFNYDTLVVKYTAYNELEKKLKISINALEDIEEINNNTMEDDQGSLTFQIGTIIDTALLQIKE